MCSSTRNPSQKNLSSAHHFILYIALTDTLFRRTSELTDSKTQYGLIPHDNWYQPDWIDEKKATEARDAMVKNQVIYGGMLCICSYVDDFAQLRPYAGSVPYV